MERTWVLEVQFDRYDTESLLEELDRDYMSSYLYNLKEKDVEFFKVNGGFCFKGGIETLRDMAHISCDGRFSFEEWDTMCEPTKVELRRL